MNESQNALNWQVIFGAAWACGTPSVIIKSPGMYAVKADFRFDRKGLLIQQLRMPPIDMQRSFAQIVVRTMAIIEQFVWDIRPWRGADRVVQVNRPGRLQPVSEYSRPEHCGCCRIDR